MVVNETLGILIVIFGLGLIVFEFIHPGAILLIPGSILVVIGALYLLYPNALLDSIYGPIAIVTVALLAVLVEIPYYRYIAPERPPMTTTTAGLLGRVGVVTSPVVPDTLRGKVRIDSETWSARSDQEIPVGTRIRVVGGEGVSVVVVPEPLAQSPPGSRRDL
ncbi:MAG: NfeD family protein [Thermoplasmata archaeon]|jgi:membrane protein implicated in regulation of membrane protease activity